MKDSNFKHLINMSCDQKMQITSKVAFNRNKKQSPLMIMCCVVVMCCPHEENLENLGSRQKTNRSWEMLQFVQNIYLFRADGHKIQSLQAHQPTHTHTHTHTHASFIQSIAEQHVATRPLSSIHIQSLQSRLSWRKIKEKQTAQLFF